MSSQESSLSDFSSTLLDMNSAQKDEDEIIVDISNSDFTKPDNDNLSDVLSQIQDDGPAYDGPAYHEPAYDEQAHDEQARARSASLQDDYHDSYTAAAQNMETVHVGVQTEASPVDELLAEKPQPMPAKPASGKASKAIPASLMEKIRAADMNRYRSLVKYGCAGLVTVAVFAALYKLDFRTSEIEQALAVRDNELMQSSTSQSENIQLQISEISKTLKSVEQGLHVIRSDYANLEENQAILLKTTMAENSVDALQVNDNVSALKQDVDVLKQQLTALTSKLDSSAAHKASAGNETSTSAADNSGLIVNLASLSDAAKARQLAEKLTQAGLSPAVQKVTIKDKKIYRVSVGGFAREAEARAFIRSAGKQYGMKDGWLRKG